jgi:hypothetical protein
MIQIKYIPIIRAEYEVDLPEDSPYRELGDFWEDGFYSTQGLYHRIKEMEFIEDYEVLESDISSIVTLFDNYMDVCIREESQREKANKKHRNKIIHSLKSGLDKSIAGFQEIMYNPYLKYQLSKSYAEHLRADQEHHTICRRDFYNFTRTNGFPNAGLSYHIKSDSTDNEIPILFEKIQLLLDACDTLPDKTVVV